MNILTDDRLTTAAAPLPSTTAHLDAMIATGAPGWLVTTYINDASKWRSASFPTTDVDRAADWCAQRDAEGRNVFVRSNLLNRPINHPGERGGNADVGACVALVVDLDVVGGGHKPGAPDRLPLPPDLGTGMKMFATLPQPSMTIHSGDGAHLWWLLDRPEVDRPVELIEEWVVRILENGRRHGWHVDRPDASRVLRVCGTHRRKPGVAHNWVTMADVAGWPAHGLRERPWRPTTYDPSELLAALPAPAEPAPADTTTRPGPPSAPLDTVGPTPADAVSQLTWAEILEPKQWKYVGVGKVHGKEVELWRRPGDPTSDYSAKCSPEGWAINWSDHSGLPAGEGQRLNKFRIFTHLHHHGDERAAARAVRIRSRELGR